MEKKVYELKIDPDLRDLIPPLTEEEHRMLEDSILRDGCDTPLTVWNGTIVDGHNRYEICRAHDIPFAYEEKDFADMDAAKFWMLEHQLARRNLNSYQRSEMVLCFEPLLKERAKQNQGTRNDLDPNFRQNSVESSPSEFSDRKMAKMAGVSHDTIRKVRTIKNSGDDETKQQLREGKKSIHKAYTEIMHKEHEGETRLCECCQQEKPYDDFTIPSKSNIPQSICKECAAKAKQAAKDAESAALQQTPDSVPTSVSGMAVVNGKLAHVRTGLPDDPTAFNQVIHMLQSAQNYYVTAFKTIIGQYGPSMINEEHNALLMEMIDNTADTIEDLFNEHIKEDK